MAACAWSRGWSSAKPEISNEYASAAFPHPLFFLRTKGVPMFLSPSRIEDLSKATFITSTASSQPPFLVVRSLSFAFEFADPA